MSHDLQSAESVVLAKEAYTFTEDWFSPNLSVWEPLLAPLRGTPGLTALEVGCFEGRASLWLLEHVLTDARARLFCVDDFHHAAYEKNFDANLAASGYSAKVTKLKGPSQAILRTLPLDSFNLIYIDGSHATSDVLEDAVLAFRLLKKDGLIIFDDYEWNKAVEPLMSPKTAINAFLDIYQEQYDIVHKEYQVILRKRPAHTHVARLYVRQLAGAVYKNALKQAVIWVKARGGKWWQKWKRHGG